MARKVRVTKAKAPVSSLEAALEFIKLAQVDKLEDIASRSHCRLANGYAVAYNGVLAIGHPIEEDLSLCPQTFRLLDALRKCRGSLSVTQLDNQRLSIRSGAFRAVVPCINPAILPHIVPDPQAGVISDVIREGFALLNPIVSGTGETVLEASLLLQNNSMVASDRLVMVEYWHGISLPGGLAIPKEAINAVCKLKGKLVGIGVTERTVTFIYESGAWLRTQLYSEKWPDVARILNAGTAHTAMDTPPALFEAIEAVASFSYDLVSNGAVYTLDGKIGSHRDENIGATYEIEGITPGLVFGAKNMLKIRHFADKIDLVGTNNVAYFYGGNVRGAITKRSS